MTHPYIKLERFVDGYLKTTETYFNPNTITHVEMEDEKSDGIIHSTNNPVLKVWVVGKEDPIKVKSNYGNYFSALEKIKKENF